MHIHLQGHMKPGELGRKLTFGKPEHWEAVFKTVIKLECGGLYVLKCKRCKAYVGPLTFSQAVQRHNCTAAALAAADVHSRPRELKLEAAHFQRFFSTIALRETAFSLPHPSVISGGETHFSQRCTVMRNENI